MKMMDSLYLCLSFGYAKKMNMRSFQYGILLDKEESFRGLVVYSDSETYLGFNISISNLHFFFFA